MASISNYRLHLSKLKFLLLKPNKRFVSPVIAVSRHTSSDQPQDSHSKPLKFTTSNAASWQAKQSRSGGDEDGMPWFQPYVISLSLSVFLVYFCILREESDVDLELEKTLYDRIEGLEERQLEITLAFNKERGLETEAIERRLIELELLKEKS